MPSLRDTEVDELYPLLPVNPVWSWGLGLIVALAVGGVVCGLIFASQVSSPAELTWHPLTLAAHGLFCLALLMMALEFFIAWRFGSSEPAALAAGSLGDKLHLADRDHAEQAAAIAEARDWICYWIEARYYQMAAVAAGIPFLMAASAWRAASRVEATPATAFGIWNSGILWGILEGVILIACLVAALLFWRQRWHNWSIGLAEQFEKRIPRQSPPAIGDWGAGGEAEPSLESLAQEVAPQPAAAQTDDDYLTELRNKKSRRARSSGSQPSEN